MEATLAKALNTPEGTGAPDGALEDPRFARLDPVLARLVQAGRLRIEAAAQTMALAEAQRQGLAAAVAATALMTSQDWATAVAHHYDLSPIRRRRPAQGAAQHRRSLAALPAPCRRSCRCAPTRARLWLAMADPGNTYAMRAVRARDRARDRARRGRRPRRSAAGLCPLLGRGPVGAAEDRRRPRRRLGEDAGADVESLIGQAQEAPVVRLVNQLLTDAVRMRASDIHIEP